MLQIKLTVKEKKSRKSSMDNNNYRNTTSLHIWDICFDNGKLEFDLI